MRGLAWPFASLGAALRGDPKADRAVPPSGAAARLALLASAAMAFLAVLALALSLGLGRLADRWSSELAGGATLRLPPNGADVGAALAILEGTPGVTGSRALTAEENQALLQPWLGPDLPLDALPVPQLIAIDLGGDFDAEGLRLRLEGEVPGAVLDDHARWREPLVAAAERLRALGAASLLLILLATGATITLAAQAALAANAQAIGVLRLVGARDSTIAAAFVRRFTGRAGAGALIGTVLGTGAVALLPTADTAGGFLAGLGFQGWGWLAPLLVPIIAAGVAFLATRAAALRALRALP